MQVKHKLYKGQTTKVVNDKGATYHEISEDAKVLVLYVSNLILLSKKNDSLKTIDFYGKYFYDRDLTEANLRKLKGLALIRRRKDDQYENAVRALREFSKANIIFSQLRNKQGQALCNAAMGFTLKENLHKESKDQQSMLKFAKKKFMEALELYEAVNHYYGQCYCLDMLLKLKHIPREFTSAEIKALEKK